MAPITQYLTLLALTVGALGLHPDHKFHPSGPPTGGPIMPTGAPFPQPNSTVPTFPTATGSGYIPTLTFSYPFESGSPSEVPTGGNSGPSGDAGGDKGPSAPCAPPVTVTVPGEEVTVTVTVTAGPSGSDGGNPGAPSPPYPIPSDSGSNGSGPTATGVLPTATAALPSASRIPLAKRGDEKSRIRRGRRNLF